jgi:hypothetical protein
MAERTSATDRSNMNPLYKPVGYFENVVKEYKQWSKNKPSAGSPEVGQFYGALLQGRRYKD